MTVNVEGGQISLVHMLKQIGLVSSTSDGYRMIDQGGVRIDGEPVDDRNLTIPAGSVHIYQVGKRRFARVTIIEKKL
jgi:tyrosyl-tRNA synthetase